METIVQTAGALTRIMQKKTRYRTVPTTATLLAKQTQKDGVSRATNATQPHPPLNLLDTRTGLNIVNNTFKKGQL